jgi:hypothetical protein
MSGFRLSPKGQGTPPPEPALRTRKPPAGRRVGACLPAELYVAFKAHVARTGATGEQVIVEAIVVLLK